MNILITLPKNLIHAIISGRKNIEIRRTFPKSFICNKDKVYVVEKGTNRILISFKIEENFKCENFSHIWALFGDRFAIDYEYYKNYTLNRRFIYLWFITDVQVFEKPILRDKDLGLKTNPQSFVYLK